MVLGLIHVGDSGTDLILTVQETVNGSNIAFNFNTNPADLVEIIIIDPDGNESAFEAEIVTPPGTDGKIHYVNLDDALFDEPGSWSAEARVTLSGGGVFTSNETIFEVLD